MRKRLSSAWLVMWVAFGLDAAGQVGSDFRVDPRSTTVVVNVGRAGLLSFAGHDHEVAAPAVEGRISLNPADMSRSRVTLQFDAKAMKVTGRGEPADDVAEVQRTMLSDRVLDVQRYPTIAFESERVSVQERMSDGFRLHVEGMLTLHGTAQKISVPVAVRLAGGRMTATGTVTVRQSAFGIRPITAAAGTVRVKDEVAVTFTIAATAD